MSRPTAGTRGSSPHARGTHNRGQGASASHRFIPACAGNAQHGCIRRSTSPVHPRMRGEQCRRGRLRSVHPRMRGERALTIGGAVLAAGSSPHARGTRLRRDRAALVARFIPACAGNAIACATGARRWPVHPRMRGERLTTSEPKLPIYGSSPHARGTLSTGSARQRHRRFIPACAGNALPISY